MKDFLKESSWSVEAHGMRNEMRASERWMEKSPHSPFRPPRLLTGHVGEALLQNAISVCTQARSRATSFEKCILLRNLWERRNHIVPREAVIVFAASSRLSALRSMRLPTSPCGISSPGLGIEACRGESSQMALLLPGEQGKQDGPSPASTRHRALADLSSPPAETRADAPLPVWGTILPTC